MSQAGRSNRSQMSNDAPQRQRTGCRLLLTIGVVGLIAVAAGLLVRSILQRTFSLEGLSNLSPESDLNPIEAIPLGAYLTLNGQALEEPSNPDAGPVIFTVESGETAAQVAERLAAEGLVEDATLLRRYLRFHGLDVRVGAGSYQLSAAMTIPEIAYGLTEAPPAEITISIPEGWRREQIADWIDAQGDLPFTGADFLLASSGPAALPLETGFSVELPTGATLEGFLFPDTYRLEIDATATDLVARMVGTFEERVTPELRNEASAQRISLYEVVTVASIVEREAAVPDERPTVASVYLNRLAEGMLLEADPTVQYAMGYQADTGDWWNLGLTQADYYEVDSPYNTYLYPGLPPGPIASPGLDAIEAVIHPAETPYFYFRATCDGSGRHNFAVTFEEHVANACP